MTAAIGIVITLCRFVKRMRQWSHARTGVMRAKAQTRTWRTQDVIDVEEFYLLPNRRSAYRDMGAEI
jgi:hypothetical protein